MKVSLDPVVVNCNEWANLFKGLNYLFNNYETQMIKRLIEKLQQLGVEETNNVLASIFAKAVFLLHEDLLREEAETNNRKGEEGAKRSTKLLNSSIKVASSKFAEPIGLREIKYAVENDLKKNKDLKATLGRKAHREGEKEVEHVEIAQAEKGKKLKKDDLLQRR